MPADDRVRFCGQCRQNVFNVAALSRDEARRLIRDARTGVAQIEIADVRAGRAGGE
jgi:xanthine dehydrogenase molybdopterin-binding subunit B